MKQCPKCKSPKPVRFFYRDPSRKDGYTVYCKEHHKQAWNRDKKQDEPEMFDVDAYMLSELFPPSYKDHERVHHIPVHKIRVSKGKVA